MRSEVRNLSSFVLEHNVNTFWLRNKYQTEECIFMAEEQSHFLEEGGYIAEEHGHMPEV
jgi:hypothetical protein